MYLEFLYLDGENKPYEGYVGVRTGVGEKLKMKNKNY
jgi:hypothetical protein